jgi:hypothetical protein
VYHPDRLFLVGRAGFESATNGLKGRRIASEPNKCALGTDMQGGKALVTTLLYVLPNATLAQMWHKSQSGNSHERDDLRGAIPGFLRGAVGGFLG